MIQLHFEKIYSTEGRWEPCSVALPLRARELTDCRRVRVYDEQGQGVPTQAKATALYPDGSVKWLFVRFMARVPAMRAVDYALELNADFPGLAPVAAGPDGADTGCLSFALSKDPGALFGEIRLGDRVYGSEAICAPALTDGEGRIYDFAVESWSLVERGEVCAILKGTGWHSRAGERAYRGEVTLHCFRDKPWIELRYHLVNTSEAPLEVRSLEIAHRRATRKNARCAVGISNYKTRFQTSEDGSPVRQVIDEQYLLYDANEHNAEVFYGTFLADCADDQGGLCATVYQAHQNFPKALEADANGLRVLLVPEGVGKVTLQSGMAREQRVLFDFHRPSEALSALNDTSTRYQMPNRPAVSPEVFARSGVIEDVFTDRPLIDVEMFLQSKADEHTRAYGMLNWGDSIDPGYTEQGRGGGELVWTNNEYDFPHACALMYARTGVRRFLDYLLVSGRHWLDVDICHFSGDPLLLHGQWEHTNGHNKGRLMACSHQWVEGLLDYYHFTGDEDALRAAIEIGENNLRRLATPEFSQPGELNARETGWALRTLVALYRQTNDEAWLTRCDWIVSHFEDWEKRYGLWLAPYTDNAHIRVVFMIAVAVASLMRYNRIRPQEKIRGMILRAVDDLLENARLDNGLFYYKELPSLQRFGNNPIILEALTIAYELTGDVKYLRAGIPTFRYIFTRKASGIVGGGHKRAVEDTVTTNGPGTKGFAQMMIPIATYYVACRRENVLTQDMLA